MNWVRRAVTEIASRSRTISHPNSLIAPSFFSTKAKTVVADWPRPSEIPYQVKVANSINIIGYVDMPVEFRSFSDGKDWAATIVNQIISKHSPPIWIPVIFEGDLAHIAASHLKPNDHVHIAGELIADSPTHNAIQGNANVQVMVHSVNFIEVRSQTKKGFASHKQEEAAVNDSVSTKKDGVSGVSSWYDLLDNPKEWRDCRSKKLKGLVNPKFPDFKRKDGTVSLWLDSAPKFILPKLAGVEFDGLSDKPKYPKQCKGEESWKNLVENPDKWWDNRLNKTKEKSPDFKHKETGEGLWLTDSPAWVLPKLPAPRSKPKWHAAKGEQKAVTGKRDTPSSWVTLGQD